jgi:hypothetical protein
MRSELPLRRNEVFTGTFPSELRIRNVSSVTVRKTEMKARFGCAIELVRRSIVSEPVSAVVREPEDVGLGMPIEADGVSNTASQDLEVAAIGTHVGDGSVTRVLRLTDIAGCAHGNVELSIGPESDEFPSVMLVSRKVVSDDDGLRRIVQSGFDVIEAKHSAHFRHVERTVTKGDTVGHVEVRGHDVDFISAPVSFAIRDGVDIVARAVAYEERSLLTQSQRPSVRNVCRVELDSEARRKMNLL